MACYTCLMTELDRLIELFIVRTLENESLSSDDVEKMSHAFRKGFMTCRGLAIDELKYLGPYSRAYNISLGEFIERRYLKIAALGETEGDFSN